MTVCAKWVTEWAMIVNVPMWMSVPRSCLIVCIHTGVSTRLAHTTVTNVSQDTTCHHTATVWIWMNVAKGATSVNINVPIPLVAIGAAVELASSWPVMEKLAKM